MHKSSSCEDCCRRHPRACLTLCCKGKFETTPTPERVLLPSSTLPGCRDEFKFRISCPVDKKSSSHGRLCPGVAQIASASCEQLSSAHFLANVVRSIGLTGDGRGARLYGADVKHMLHVRASGLYQDPLQISEALVHLGQLPPVQTYVEVGCFAAWTASVVAAFLRRVHSRSAHGRHFRGFVVDVTRSAIRESTFALLQQLNVSFVPRSELNSRLLQPARGRSTPAYDLCFVDGDHSYVGVRKDYFEMAPFCRDMMFHDVADTSTARIDSFSGGVPLFCAPAAHEA